jgi:precorrin-2 dehydrogenase/sirohydrochlorin ferrochelatase
MSGQTVVVIGGGSVGRRKATEAAEAGATVRVIDLQPRPRGFDHQAIAWISEAYHPEQLTDARLVLACGPAALNAKVVADATARGLWVCDAAEPRRGTVVLPAVVRVGPVTIAVSTGGASPVLARRLAQKWGSELDDAFGHWLQLLAELRAEAKAMIPDPDKRRQVLTQLTDWSWWHQVRDHGYESAKAAMLAVIHEAGP